MEIFDQMGMVKTKTMTEDESKQIEKMRNLNMGINQNIEPIIENTEETKKTVKEINKFNKSLGKNTEYEKLVKKVENNSKKINEIKKQNKEIIENLNEIKKLLKNKEEDK